MQVTATDADDPTYGNSARLVYSILQGQPYFSVESQTGMYSKELEKKMAARQPMETYDVTLLLLSSSISILSLQENTAFCMHCRIKTHCVICTI